MTTVNELMKQKMALEIQIAQALREGKSRAIAEACALIRDFELTEQDVFGGAKRARVANAKKGTVAPKYKDPMTGATWTGRGKTPKWLDGKDRSQFAI